MTTTYTLDFDLTEKQEKIRSFLRTFAANATRPASVIADADEQQRPMATIEALHQLQSGGMGHRNGSAVDGTGDGSVSAKELVSIIRAEELQWGAASIPLPRPGPSLGGAAIQGVGDAGAEGEVAQALRGRHGSLRRPGAHRVERRHRRQRWRDHRRAAGWSLCLEWRQDLRDHRRLRRRGRGVRHYRRLVAHLPPVQQARTATDLIKRAVVALSEGRMLDLARVRSLDELERGVVEPPRDAARA